MKPDVLSIAFVAESLGAGGAERQMVELIKNLDRSRFALRVFAYAAGDFFLNDLVSCGVTVHSIVRRSRFDLSPIWQLRSWLRSGEVHIVHSYLKTANLYSVVARLLAGKGKVIVSERCSPGADGKDIAGRLSNWTFRKADLVIANSDYARQQILEATGIADGRILYIPNAIDTDRFKPISPLEKKNLRRSLGLPADRRIVLSVGRFSPQKNYTGILDAIALMERENLPLTFVWIGAKPHQELFAQIVNTIERERLSESVIMLDATHEISQWYQAADIFLLNSLFEGTPNVVLEAIASGLPVIATRVSDVPLYVIDGENGWLVTPSMATQLAEVLSKVSAMSEEALSGFGKRGYERIRKLHLDSHSLAQRHEQVYSELISLRTTRD